MRKPYSVCAELGLTQQDLALLLGVSRGLISMYETGRRELPIAAFLRLCELQRHLHEDSTDNGKKEVDATVDESVRKTFKDLLDEKQYQLKRIEQKIRRTQEKREIEESKLRFKQMTQGREISKSMKTIAELLAQKLDVELRGNRAVPTLALLDHQKEMLEYEIKVLAAKFA